MLNRTSTQRWALKTSENSAESHQVYREGEGPLNCSPENTLKNGCSDTHKHYESTSLISIQFSKCELQKLLNSVKWLEPQIVAHNYLEYNKLIINESNVWYSQNTIGGHL